MAALQSGFQVQAAYADERLPPLAEHCLIPTQYQRVIEGEGGHCGLGQRCQFCWQPDRRLVDNNLIAAAGSKMTSLAKELAAKTDQDGAWYLPDKWSEDMKDETGQPMSKRQGMK